MMTNVIWPTWSRPAVSAPTADEAVFGKNATLHAEVTLARAKLAAAREDGGLILAAMTDHLREIEQTIDFCQSCRAALDATDLDEMMRLRDDLSAVLKRRRTRPDL